jgi:dephospho-CoA kinase
MQIKEVAKIAEFNIDNSGTIENLYNRLDNILTKTSQ